ncbi:MAG: carbohydrate porin [Alphaproteobacteria bacterium]|nr:carbohydrate porin [Alphaproteobacteria bacterium]MBV8412476.1 carbohydrate porin [Alphaproteobacteria bacterium]
MSGMVHYAGRLLAAALIGGVLCGAGARAQQDPLAGQDRDGAAVRKLSDRNMRRLQFDQESFEQGVNARWERYLGMKKEIADATGLQYTMNASMVSQWGVPGGGYGAVQAEFTPAIDWDVFDNPTFGAGSFQFSFLSVDYWSGATGDSVASAIGVNGPINDKPLRTNIFSQLTYTHESPNDRVALTVGQYSFANFDSNQYADDQQMSFIANGMTGNISETYSQGALGAYLHVYPGRHITLAAGFQDANNPSGSFVQFNTLGNGAYAWFLYAGQNPTIPGLGKGHYSFLYYNVPAVPTQPQPSVGYSFNAAQHLTDRLGVFLRANTASGNAVNVSSSVSGGAVLENPLGRDPSDRIGIALAWNEVNRSFFSNTAFTRPSETMLEFYWSWGLLRRFVITPDIQVYLQPALSPADYVAAVFTLRVTQLF